MIRSAYIFFAVILLLASTSASAIAQTNPKKCKPGYELKKVTKKVVYYKWVTNKQGKKVKKRLSKKVTRKECVKKAETKHPENPSPAPQPQPQKSPEENSQPPSPSDPSSEPVIPDRTSLMSVLARDPDAKVSPRWSLTPSRHAVPSGTITIDFVNYGGDPHNLLLRRPDGSSALVSEAISGDLGEGPGVRQSSIRVPAGQYVLYCAIGNHEQLGMRADLLVTD